MTRSNFALACMVLIFAMFLIWTASTEASGPPKTLDDLLTFVGTVPNSWGDVVGVSGDFNHPTLVFRNEKGELRIITVVGTQLPQKGMLIKRSYHD